MAKIAKVFGSVSMGAEAVGELRYGIRTACWERCIALKPALHRRQQFGNRFPQQFFAAEMHTNPLQLVADDLMFRR